ncbi:urocanate hydratase [bacterium]|nr:urocanate hydratase [bacterium]
MADKPSQPPSAPKGATKRCATWDIEAAYRLLQNNLDPRVALDWENLVVYGGTGRAARTWTDYHQILRALERLEPDETLCIQSGRPVYVGKTHKRAPRILIANSNLVPHWATPDVFSELDRKGLMMYGQMTAGSWIYIGTQGILQGTYQTFVALAEIEYGTPDLSRRWILTGGMGAMSGAQPLAGAMAGAAILVVESVKARIQKKCDQGFCDRMTDNLDEALAWKDEAILEGRGLSIGLVGNIATIAHTLLERDEIPDIVTDQTSAHDLLSYWPEGNLEALEKLKRSNPSLYRDRSAETILKHTRAILGLKARGAIAFDYGNALRDQAERAGLSEIRLSDGSFAYPGFLPAYVRPLFCQGMGPFRWAALSGNPDDIRKTDEAMLALFPEDLFLHRWIRLAQERVPFEGMPTRICWLGYGDRAKAGLLLNEMVASGEVDAPIAIGRDHLDTGSVASPSRETEAMKDGSDAVADWPLLNFGLNTASGASWVSFHSGGGVGTGLSMHAGVVVVADGTPERREILQTVLTNDPGLGVARHADAGYREALDVARERGVDLGKDLV